MAKGENTPREEYHGCCYGTHAEMAAVKHLLRTTLIKGHLDKHSRRLKLDLYVIRINRGGTFGMSKPCENCIFKLHKITGIKIVNVYYSDNTGELQKIKFTNLYEEACQSKCSTSRGRR